LLHTAAEIGHDWAMLDTVPSEVVTSVLRG
jgi:hypothetical protein